MTAALGWLDDCVPATAGLVKLAAAAKHPSGAAAKLLQLVEAKGIEALMV